MVSFLSRRFGWPRLASTVYATVTLAVAMLLSVEPATAQIQVLPKGSLLTIIGGEQRDYVRIGKVGSTLRVLEGNSATLVYSTPVTAVTRIRFFGNGGDDQFSFGLGFDPQIQYHADHPVFELYGGAGRDQLHGGSKGDLIVGGPDQDTLRGFQGDDVLLGEAGGDYLVGESGNDFLCGGTGPDRLYAGAGNDWVFSGPDEGYYEVLSSKPGNDFEAREPCSYTPADLVGDWDGDGVAEKGFYLPERSVFLLPGGPQTVVEFGLPGDTPVVGNWMGTGIDRPGVFRNGWFYLDVGARFGWGPDGPEELGIPFGLPGDTPIVGDWERRGVDRVGVYRGGTHYLDVGHPGWTGQHPEEFPGIQFGGLPGDVPVVGDWDGNGFSDVGVFRVDLRWYLDEGARGWWTRTNIEVNGSADHQLHQSQITHGPSWLFGL